jgi:hypothetical protein
VKKNLVAIALLLSSLAGGHGDASNDARIVKDGACIGLSKMPSLSPEDPEVAWFHENTLLVENDQAILDEVPLSIRHSEKTYSAADGGFLTCRVRFIVKDGHNVAEMRELQGVRYGPTALKKAASDHSRHLLSTEPLGKNRSTVRQFCRFAPTQSESVINSPRGV